MNVNLIRLPNFTYLTLIVTIVSFDYSNWIERCI